VFIGGYTWGVMNSLPEIHNFAALGSSLCCIGAIASLSSQKTARFGNNLGIVSFLEYMKIIIIANTFTKILIQNDYRSELVEVLFQHLVILRHPQKFWLK